MALKSITLRLAEEEYEKLKAHLAEFGDPDINVAFENEWDVAGGTLLTEETGGMMSDGSGQALKFNQPDPRYRGIVATHPACPDPVRRQLRALARATA